MSGALAGGRPSSTAERAAVLRAAHQLLDQPPLLDDPLAVRIIGAARADGLRADPARVQTPELRALRASIVVRSRYAEDRLAAAVERGIRQYVILGAGLDTFGYRNPHAASGLHVYELDHPATQTWKRARLAEVGIVAPPSLTFVPIDFEREAPLAVLRGAGFRPDHPSFFSWLGVTMYLTRDAVMQTLALIASSSAPGSEIVFSYVVAPSALATRAGDLGEPWRTFFDPEELTAELRQLGFSAIEDLGPQEANARYFAQRTDALRLAGSGHIVAARVS
jgi:methyltransferase (TIGR00027 family)